MMATHNPNEAREIIWRLERDRKDLAGHAVELSATITRLRQRLADLVGALPRCSHAVCDEPAVAEDVTARQGHPLRCAQHAVQPPTGYERRKYRALTQAPALRKAQAELDADDGR